MFKNIGEKIETIAILIFILGISIAVFFAIICFLIAVGTESGAMALIGIFGGLLGAAISWISSVLVYSYGNLVRNTEQQTVMIRQYMDMIKEANNKETVEINVNND